MPEESFTSDLKWQFAISQVKLLDLTTNLVLRFKFDAQQENQENSR